DVALRAVQVRRAEPRHVHRAVGAHDGPRVGVRLAGALVADHDRPGPRSAVVVRVRELDRRVAGTAELRPRDVQPSVVMTAAGPGVDGYGLVVRLVASAALDRTIRGRGGDLRGRGPRRSPVAR